jgi:hypothetical protein
MTKRTKIALVAGTAVLALAGIGGGVAVASGDTAPATTTPAAAASTTAAAPGGSAAARHRRALLRRAEHAEVTLRTKTGDRVVDVQRGQVTSVGPTSVVVRSKDGFTGTYTVTGTSKVRSKKKAATIGDVRKGDRVVVVGVRAGTTTTVRRLADAGPPK